jgi:hypothetical protein
MKSSRWFCYTWLLGVALGLSHHSFLVWRLTKVRFEIYKNKPAGRQLSGQHAPAATPHFPRRPRSEIHGAARLRSPTVRGRAEVVKSVAMTWDERGRLWIVELYSIRSARNKARNRATA